MFSGGQFTERKSRGNCEPYTLGCQRWAGREGIKSQHTEGGRVSSHAGSQTALIPEAINDSHSFILGCIPKYKWDSSCVLCQGAPRGTRGPLRDTPRGSESTESVFQYSSWGCKAAQALLLWKPSGLSQHAQELPVLHLGILRRLYGAKSSKPG